MNILEIRELISILEEIDRAEKGGYKPSVDEEELDYFISVLKLDIEHEESKLDFSKAIEETTKALTGSQDNFQKGGLN